MSLRFRSRFPENEIIHSDRMLGLTNEPDGNFDFLRTGRIR